MSAVRIDDAWQVKAACRGPQAAVFFPPSHFERKDEKLEREGRAKAICVTCPVRQPCLDYALKITREMEECSPDDIGRLKALGFTDEDVWDIAEVAAMFNFTNLQNQVMVLAPSGNRFYRLKH